MIPKSRFSQSTHLIGTHAAIVGTLWSWETVLGPAKWIAIEVKERVLLFDAKPRLLLDALVHHLQARFALVSGRRCAIKLVGIAHDQNVVATPEGILVDGHRIQISVRVAALRLVARAAIVIPNGQF